MREGKIIIIDDNDAILKMLRVILSREFKTIIPATSPNLLPAFLRNNDVDIVLLDMNFTAGKQNGQEGRFWLNYILEQKNPPAVILLTAYGDIDLAISTLKKGATDFIIKPFENSTLTATIVSVWEKRMQAKANEKSFLKSEGANKQDSADLFINYFLNKYTTLYGKPYPTISIKAREKLILIFEYGQLQVLEQCIERAILLNDDAYFTEKHFRAEKQLSNELPTASLDEMEKQFISTVLLDKKGNLTLVAKQLKISRQTLYNKMKKYNL